MDSFLGCDKQDLPDFKIDANKIPQVSLKSIQIENFKVFPSYSLSFNDNFDCFFGPNGTGKSTVLEIIQLIFSRLSGYEDYRLKEYLKKSLRKDSQQAAAQNFLISAEIKSSIGDYTVEITKEGFQKDHPDEIKELLYRILLYTRYDQELHTFNLPRIQWPTFKRLFEAVTGFEIEEQKDVFSESVDPIQADLLSRYVLGFIVKKPYETIPHKNCSAGERKIIKSFSTILSKEYVPQIILIDNVEMHVESSRHIHLVKEMQASFKNSQIVATTHSYPLARYYPNREQMHDLRLLKVPDIIREQPWRLALIDEIEDALAKIQTMSLQNEKTCKYRQIGTGLIDFLNENNRHDIQQEIFPQVSDFLGVTQEIFVENVRKCAKN